MVFLKKMISFFLGIFLLLNCFLAPFAQTAEEKPLLTLQALQQEFAAVYPENKAALARIAAAEADATSEARFMAPEVSLEWMSMPKDSGFSSAEQLNYKVSQRFDFPLKQAFAYQAAKYEAKQVSAEEQMKLAETLASFKQAYFQFIYASLELKLNRELQGTLGAFVKQSSIRYAQNTQVINEPLEFSLELGTLKNEANELEAMRAEAEAGLKALGHVELARYRLPEQFPKLLGVPTEEQLADLLPTTPWWKLQENAVQARKKQQQQSRAAFFPDFMLGAEYQQRKLSQDAWSFELGLSIPFAPWSKTYAEQRAASKRLLAEKLSRAAEEQHLVHEFSMLRSHMQHHREAAVRAKSQLMPESRLLLKTTSMRYGLHKLELADVLRAYKLYREAAGQAYQHEYEYWLARAELEKNLGKTLEDL